MGIDLQKMRRSTLAFQNIDFDDVTANSELREQQTNFV